MGRRGRFLEPPSPPCFFSERPTMRTHSILLAGLLLITAGCSHGSSEVQQQPVRVVEPGRTYAYEAQEDEGVRTKGDSVSTRILVLINNGQFAEAEALIAEAKASGLLTAPTAARLLDRISVLNMRLGQTPATLQRAPDFPSQLKDYTLFEIKQMLQQNDFSLATKAQLQMVKKLIEQPDRLMGKL
jgi:hypothetical protein